MRSYLTLTALVIATPGWADTVMRVDPGRAAAEAIQVQADRNNDGYLDAAELESLSREAFSSIDNNGDALLTRNELQSWEFGFGDLAAFRGRDQGYNVALDIVFGLLDRNGDGDITDREHATAMTHFFAIADDDADGRLSRTEYYTGFVFNVAMRSALVEQ